MINILAGILIGAIIETVIIAVVLYWGRRRGVLEVCIHEDDRAAVQETERVTELKAETAALTEQLIAIDERLASIEAALAPYLDKK